MTFADLYLACKTELATAGIPDADFEAVTLLRHFFRLTQSEWLLKKRETPPAGRMNALQKAIIERRNRRPLQYILGEWEFMGIEIAVGEGVLIPRDDTEVLVRAVSDYLGGRPAAGADLCAGTGAVSLALCSLHPDTQITAVELSGHAFPYLTENTDTYAEYDIMPVQGDIFDEALANDFTRTFDFIACNPPYIARNELSSLQAEVQREPAMALDGGDDGLTFYRAVTAIWKKTLKPGGLLAFEIGETQAEAVSDILRENGFTSLAIHRDLSGLPRCALAVQA